MGHLRLVTIILVTLFSSACHGFGLEDVTQKPPYSEMKGVKYRVQESVWLTGITYNIGHSSKLDTITLVPGVGFTGPEVIFRERLGKGAIVEIKKILLDKSMFSSTVEYVVEIDGYHKYEGVERKIRLSRGNEGDDLELDTTIYKRVE